ncbi:hypothetical protein Tco_0737241 [Tanacetum coccineum]
MRHDVIENHRTIRRRAECLRTSLATPKTKTTAAKQPPTIGIFAVRPPEPKDIERRHGKHPPPLRDISGKKPSPKLSLQSNTSPKKTWETRAHVVYKSLHIDVLDFHFLDLFFSLLVVAVEEDSSFFAQAA